MSNAMTTDSYGVDDYCREHGVSRNSAIIRMSVPEEDWAAVGLYSNYILNTSGGGLRPSDAAAQAVREYKRNPDAIRNRQSGCAPR